MIEFLRLAKNPRVRFRNAWNIRRNLMNKGQSVDLGPTQYYDRLSLRPNLADWIAFEQVFRYLCYGGLEKMGSFSTVIDAGANIGLSAVFFSKRLGAPEIVALEPEENNFTQAVFNTQTLSNVEVLRAALWPRQEPLYISNQETSGSLGFQVKTSTEPHGTSILKTLTIPEIMLKRGWQTLDLLKIDIEGAEKDLFEEPSQM
jgi:FkbM family methyltransferase